MRMVFEVGRALFYLLLFGDQRFEYDYEHHCHEPRGEAAVVAVHPAVESSGVADKAGMEHTGDNAPPEFVLSGDGAESTGEHDADGDALSREPADVALKQGGQRVAGEDGPDVENMASVGGPTHQAEQRAHDGAGEGRFDDSEIRKPENAQNAEVYQAQRCVVKRAEIGFVTRSFQKRAITLEAAVEDRAKYYREHAYSTDKGHKEQLTALACDRIGGVVGGSSGGNEYELLVNHENYDADKPRGESRVEQVKTLVHGGGVAGDRSEYKPDQ